MYIETNVYECFTGKEFSYNENGKFQYILSTPIWNNRLFANSGFIRWGGVYFTI